MSIAYAYRTVSRFPEDQQSLHSSLKTQMGEEAELREQDKWLPIANVYRIMKNALPKNAKVSKEAKECVQECVSEFVSFITSEASEKCSAEKRKTVNGEDILFAMASLGFENYAEVLKIYLTKYREYQTTKEKHKRISATGSDQQPNESSMVSADSSVNSPAIPDLKAERASPSIVDYGEEEDVYDEFQI